MRLFTVKEEECCGRLIPNDEEFCEKYLKEHPEEFDGRVLSMKRKICQNNNEIVKDFMLEYMYKIYLQEHSSYKMDEDSVKETISAISKFW